MSQSDASLPWRAVEDVAERRQGGREVMRYVIRSLPELVVLPLAVAVLEAGWLSLWLLWLARRLRPELEGALIPFWDVAALVVGGNWLGRLALAGPRERPLAQARRWVAGCGMLAVWAAMWSGYGDGYAPWDGAWLGQFLKGLVQNWRPISAQALSLLTAVYLWWRGIKAGQAAAPHEDLRRTYYRGLFGLALLIWLAGRSPRLTVGSIVAAEEIWRAVLLYFAVGLSALALASADRALRLGREITGSRLALSRYWLAAAAGVIAAVLAGAMLAGWLVTPEPIRAIFAVLTPVVRILVAGLLAVFIAIVYVGLLIAQLVAPAILSVLEFIGRLPTLGPAAPPDFGQLTQEVTRLIDAYPAARLALNGGGIVLLLAAIAFVFWLALVRLGRWPRGASGVDETRESIASRVLIAGQLRDLLAKLRPRRAREANPYLRLDGPPGDRRLLVRRAYQAMLAWAVERGHPRDPALTPDRYAERLSARLPQMRDPLALLTAAYLKARYASQSPSTVEVEQAQQALDRLKQIESANQSRQLSPAKKRG